MPTLRHGVKDRTTHAMGPPFGNMARSSEDDSTEDVVDSMRRYTTGNKKIERKETTNIGRIRSPLMDQIDDDTPFAQSSFEEGAMDDVQQVKMSPPMHPPVGNGPAPMALDLEPIISLVSSLHASSHVTSTELINSILVKHEQQTASDRAESNQNRQTVVQQVQDAQAEVARLWEDMRQEDDRREKDLKQLLDTVNL